MIRAVLIKTRIISAKTILLFFFVFLLFAPPWPGELVGQLIK